MQQVHSNCPEVIGWQSFMLWPAKAFDNDCESRCVKPQVPDSDENLSLVDFHSSTVERMGMPCVGSAEVIPMTEIFPVSDLQPHILNGFSWDKVLIHLLHTNHVSNPASWNIVQSWGYEQSMGRDDPTGGVILVLFIKHNISHVLGLDGANSTKLVHWLEEVCLIGSSSHILGPKYESLSFPIPQIPALCWDFL
jgi:hypothetical protein